MKTETSEWAVRERPEVGSAWIQLRGQVIEIQPRARVGLQVEEPLGHLNHHLILQTCR